MFSIVLEFKHKHWFQIHKLLENNCWFSTCALTYIHFGPPGLLTTTGTLCLPCYTINFVFSGDFLMDLKLFNFSNFSPMSLCDWWLAVYVIKFTKLSFCHLLNFLYLELHQWCCILLFLEEAIYINIINQSFRPLKISNTLGRRQNVVQHFKNFVVLKHMAKQWERRSVIRGMKLSVQECKHMVVDKIKNHNKYYFYFGLIAQRSTRSPQNLVQTKLLLKFCRTNNLVYYWNASSI